MVCACRLGEECECGCVQASRGGGQEGYVFCCGNLNYGFLGGGGINFFNQVALMLFLHVVF